MPFAVEHFSSVQLAFPVSDYYGTADCPLLSLHCDAQAMDSQTFPYFYPFFLVESLGPYFTPGESNHALSYSSCMIPHSHFVLRGVHGKTCHERFLQCSPFQTPVNLRCLHRFLYRSHGFRKPAPLFPCTVSDV